MKVTAVIMAGGRGERFWPKSRGNYPKQFLSLTKDGETMIQKTVKRLLPMVAMEDVFVVTNVSYAALVKEQLPQLPEENILLEPCARNTAPCIGLAAAVIRDALLYIHQHYTEELPLARVAQALYRSPEYFSRQFKAEVGENFSVYLTLYRLERAQELLRRTDLSVGEIACRVGYTTPGYFGRLYKKYLGITPEQERMSK